MKIIKIKINKNKMQKMKTIKEIILKNNKHNLLIFSKGEVDNKILNKRKL